MSTKPLITLICDLDGTLTNCDHRKHLAAQRDWDGFHALCHLDKPIQTTLDALWLLINSAKVDLHFLTGRDEANREVTEQWLWEECEMSLGTEYRSLIMRPKNDFTRTGELKVLQLNQLVEEEGIDRATVIVLDDNIHVVEALRNEGYIVWQTTMGDF